MVASIIPYTKTVRGVEWFDYAIPYTIAVERGDIVEIPFRSTKILGLVWNTSATPTITTPIKPIYRVVNTYLWRDPQRLKLLKWFATYYCVSLPTAWKTLQFSIPQRPRVVKNTTTTPHNAPAACKPTVKKQLHAGLCQHKPLIIRWNTNEQRSQLYQEIINQSHHTLIIVSEYTDIPSLTSNLKATVLRTSTAEPSPSQLLTWSTPASSTPSVTIGTKKMLSLPLQHFDTIILDHEDARSHKQFDNNPRYHVRDVLIQYQSLQNNIHVVLSSAAPSTVVGRYIIEHHWPIVDVSTTWSQHIQVVDMEDERRQQNYSWFSEPVQQLLHNPQQTILLFLNRTGTYRAALCRDCGTTLPLSSLTCTTCHGTHITKLRKGIETIEKELQHIMPHRHIVRIEKEQSTTEPIPPGSVVIATEKIWRTTSLSLFNTIVILSIDHLLTYPHFRSHERVFGLLVQLFRTGRPIILQTNAPHHPVIRSAITNNYKVFLNHDLPLRKLLRVPPYGEYVQLINTTTRTTSTVQSLDCTSLAPTVIVDRQ